MRYVSVTFLAAMLAVVAGSASAGNLTLVNGKAQWQATTCTEPAEPASLLAADKESHAGSMNSLMETYNTYTAAMQAYMDCVSKEADSDSTSINQAISTSAESAIATAQGKVTTLNSALQAKQ
jgi:hypothetical protein